MSQYLDLTSAVNEVEDSEPFRFNLDGVEFEIPTTMTPKRRKAFALAMREEDLEALLTATFGEDELARLDELELSVPQLMIIMNAYNTFLSELEDITVGESQASTSSSKSTGVKSKSTSRARTRR